MGVGGFTELGFTSWANDFTFTVPYAKVRDLLKPELTALLPPG